MTGDEGSRAGLVSPSDIAQMAGRTRAAVSNWRANERLRFPARAGGTDTRPLFNLDEVTAWLAKRDIQVEKDSPEVALWTVVNSARGKLRVDVVATTVVTILVACQLADQDVAVQRVWADVTQADPSRIDNVYDAFVAKVDRLHDGKWSGLLNLDPSVDRSSNRFLAELITVATSVAPRDRADTADQTLKRMAAAQGRVAGEHGLVGSRTSRLLANAIRGQDARRVYDPAMGIGELLLTIHATAPTAELMGEDINREAVRVARQRAVLAGVEIHTGVGDVLTGKDALPVGADIIVAEPPFGLRQPDGVMLTDPRWRFGLPTRSSTELLWLQHALFHLAPGGRAFVVTGRGPLFRGGADKQVRAELLRSGAVETVVGLPPRMLPHTSISLALWILRDPAETSGDVLVVDATETDAPEDHIGKWLREFVAGSTDRNLPPHTKVAIDDILADDAILQPERWVEGPTLSPSDVVRRFEAAREALSSRVQVPSIDVQLPSAFAHSRVVTIKSLVSDGLASLSAGTADPKHVDEAASVWDVQAVREALENTEMDPDKSKPDGTGTATGDIIIVSTGSTGAVVDRLGGRLVARGLHQLRVTSPELDAEYVAACIMGSWNARYRSGTAIQRVDPRDLEIPLVPLSEQRLAVDLLTQAAAVRAHARAIEAAAQDVVSSLLDAIRYHVTIGEPQQAEERTPQKLGRTGETRPRPVKKNIRQNEERKTK